MKKIDGSKRLVDVTLEEARDYFKFNAPEEDEIVTTEELAEILNCAVSTIQNYYREYNMPRVKKNAWKKNLCIAWVEKELPKILRSHRTKK